MYPPTPTPRRIFFVLDLDLNPEITQPANPTLRYLIYWLLRYKRVGDDNGCHIVNGDRRCFDATPTHRCPNCPLTYLDKHSSGPFQPLLICANELSFSLGQGFAIRWEEVSVTVYLTLKILAEEREKLVQEQEQEQQLKQRVNQALPPPTGQIA